MYSRQQLEYLDAMGIPAWIERRADQPPPNPEEAVDISAPGEIVALPSPDSLVDWLAQQWVRSRETAGTQQYLVGDPAARLLLLADDQAQTGEEPFAGQSARLLQAMLQAIGASTDSVLRGITTSSAVGTSLSVENLLRQFDSVRAVLYYTCPAGSHGCADLDQLRERTFHLGGTLPCVVSYHPSCLLEQADLKRAAWNDLKRIRQLLA